MQETLANSPGVVVKNHLRPLQCAIPEPVNSRLSTPRQNLGDVHERPLRPASPESSASPVQRWPSQRSRIPVGGEPGLRSTPPAMQNVAEAHDTEERSPGTLVCWSVHEVPSQVSPRA